MTFQPSTHDDPSALVPARLKSFLATDCVKAVYMAGGGGAAPELAYITPFPRLSVVLSGTHSMSLAGRHAARHISPGRGEAVFVGPHRWNKPDWSVSATVLAILVGRHQVGVSLVEHAGGADEPVAAAKVALARPLDEVTDHLLAALCALHPVEAPGPLPTLLVESLLQALLAQLRQPLASSAGKARQTFDAICLYVQENAHIPLTRASVARYFGLSDRHVSRLFHSIGAMRFSDYVNLVRVNRAKVLLGDPRRTVSQVAGDCGYADTAYFCRVFRRFVKMTPTTYRASRR